MLFFFPPEGGTHIESEIISRTKFPPGWLYVEEGEGVVVGVGVAGGGDYYVLSLLLILGVVAWPSCLNS